MKDRPSRISSSKLNFSFLRKVVSENSDGTAAAAAAVVFPLVVLMLK